MRGCHSEYIVTFYGSFLNDNNDVIMCMEYMDVGYVISGGGWLGRGRHRHRDSRPFAMLTGMPHM